MMIKFSGIILATLSSQNIIFSQADRPYVTSDADFDTQRQRLADSSGRAIDAAVQKQCKDTEALLHVKYTDSQNMHQR
jgi:methionine synthase II (cobalamin-independent)